MIKKVRNLILLVVTGSMLFAPMLLPVAVGAVSADSILSGICTGVNNATNANNSNNCGTAGNGNTDLHKIATKIINIFSIVVGIIAVVMVIYGGFKYITSGGDSGNVSGAKSTLVYAVVGLIIVALAQFLVHFVINTANTSVQ